ncbi:MAG: PRC-barrel domain-containing protein [Alphaproteobacteria bacterium]|nr:PRC-barrel domain-containing protein [Alphaproteobacteria bacterium]MBU1514549.1 PRC-barrel domain-containing protein [Alphaproteobacteria bacterium]MBU2096819.1 PRC-barrel domain-containing protein [Alphaproteobacteria bacterium]MBU2153446.1 PRC-barrel domain-containing protein [Alphaproteobacteria bacterium]MBU2306049.1 PRC-barrel domain-containing protein [Alphaproteobacteria bacterium]
MTDGLTKSADVLGRRLLGHDAVKLGVVREMFLDLETGQIAFLIVEGGGLLGGSGKFQPVPWAAVRHDVVGGHFQIAMAKDAFKAAPAYDREQLGAAGYAWSEQSARFFADLGDGLQPTVAG